MKQEYILYHGSENIIEKPTFRAGRRRNDYGYGFYCTEQEDIAKEWSVDLERDGFANCYTLKTDGLSVLNLNDGNYTILHWLAVLLENRKFDVSSALAREGRQYILENFSVPYADADIVIGYRADDSYFSFASDFIGGTISVRQLEMAMRLGRLGEQVVLKSKKSHNRIRFQGYERVAANVWYEKKMKRDETARAQYRAMDKDGFVRGDLYMPMILESGVTADDARIQRIIYR